MDYNQKEIEQLLQIASYHEEIARRKLASQMVLTLGEDCDREKVVRILAGDYLGATIQREELRKQNIECEGFYVTERAGKISVVVCHPDGERAEVYADYGAPGGILAVGEDTARTMDGTVYELGVADAEEFHIIVYRYPVEYEMERITKKDF